MRVGQRVEFLDAVNRSGTPKVSWGVVYHITMDARNEPQRLSVTRSDGSKAWVCAKTARVVS